MLKSARMVDFSYTGNASISNGSNTLWGQRTGTSSSSCPPIRLSTTATLPGRKIVCNIWEKKRTEHANVRRYLYCEGTNAPSGKRCVANVKRPCMTRVPPRPSPCPQSAPLAKLGRVHVNAITTCDGSGATGLGLFPLAAMFNHSCSPNLQAWWRGSKARLCFDAIRASRIQSRAGRERETQLTFFFVIWVFVPTGEPSARIARNNGAEPLGGKESCATADPIIGTPRVVCRIIEAFRATSNYCKIHMLVPAVPCARARVRVSYCSVPVVGRFAFTL